MVDFFSGKAVYTIPPGARFLPAVIEGVSALCREYGVEAPDITLFLPNRRAVRAFHETFAVLSGGKPSLMPRLQALGDLDEGEMVLSGFVEAGEEALPPAVSPMRRLFLIRNLLKKRSPSSAPDLFSGEQGLALAGELARLLDQMQNEDVPASALEDIAPDDLAVHWQEMLHYLSVITHEWPALLKREGLMDASARRNLLIGRMIEAWRKAPTKGVILAAGSTGSLPPVRRFLAAIARLPKGAVILPGLDQTMDLEAWESLSETHNQYGLKRTLKEIGVAREDVRPFPWAGAEPARARLRFLSAALLPPAVTARWFRTPAFSKDAVEGLELVEAASLREEAGAIALVLRETLEEKGKTAALVTPDRGLAERVKGELARFGIEVDDSAGTPLSRTPPGAYLLLLAEMAAAGFAPVPLLAFLKHPFTYANLSRGELLARARLIDRKLLRGVRLGAGLATLKAGARKLKAKQDRDGLLSLIERIGKETMRLAALLTKRRVSFASLLAAHVKAAEALAGESESGGPLLYEREAGESLLSLLEALREEAPALGAVPGEDYPAVLKVLLAAEQVRPRFSRHPRLFIWGTLEARLQYADVLILGGLNEGAWPPAPPPDPWMSREMRKAIGLPTHDLRIGKAAHDFWMAVAAKRVVLTRALKVEGTPAAPSRWLMRMKTLAGNKLPLRARHPWTAWLASLDHPEEERRERPPAPRPPAKVRPRKLSVTQVETWMRDPYAIYARHVLGLKPLEEIDADPGAAERGTLLHGIFDAYLKEAGGVVPEGGLQRLVEIGVAEFARLAPAPAIRAFWWPRFLKVAEAFITRQIELQAIRRPAVLEGEGEWRVTGVSPPFTLSARADRIDRVRGGEGLIVIDYKTGGTPARKDILAGFAPQLPLEGIMAEAGGFPGLDGGRIEGIEFWKLGDPRNPCWVIPPKLDVEEVLAEARRGIAALIKAFVIPASPYLASPDPARRPAYPEYDLLARYEEWRFYPPEEEAGR